MDKAGPAAAVAAGVGAAIVGVLVWMGFYQAALSPYVPAILSLLSGPLIGLMVGGAMQIGGRHPALRPTAAALAVLAGVVGFVLTDMYLMTWTSTATGQPVQPTVADALGRFANDIAAWLLIGLGGFLAWSCAPPR